MKFVYHPLFLRHDTGMHPENPGRFELILRTLKNKGGLVEPKTGERYIKLAHSPEYVDKVRDICDMGGGYLDVDTPVSAESYKAACYAVGAAIEASELGGFALVRPPGHHATYDQGMGFCIFNNMAISALRLANKGKKVFILDVDIHHGNGTQDLVFGKDNIMFLSIHQSPLYPGTGLFSEGNCFNFPLKPNTTDRGYMEVLDNEVLPRLAKFDPDVVGVSVGFDAYHKDVGWVAGNHFLLTKQTYLKINGILSQYKTFYVLEGGYNPSSIVEGIEALTAAVIPKI
ncbi:MAG: histone deacetylase [Candidatus Altiarchaeota archaeon]|nr:histone deacetylase [Candidatus Altiarchaeota archaeon]